MRAVYRLHEKGKEKGTMLLSVFIFSFTIAFVCMILWRHADRFAGHMRTGPGRTMASRPGWGRRKIRHPFLTRFILKFLDALAESAGRNTIVVLATLIMILIVA